MGREWSLLGGGTLETRKGLDTKIHTGMGTGISVYAVAWQVLSSTSLTFSTSSWHRGGWTLYKVVHKPNEQQHQYFEVPFSQAAQSI